MIDDPWSDTARVMDAAYQHLWQVNVKFLSLLPKSQELDEKFHTVEKDGQLVFVKNNEAPKIKSIHKWMEAFHVFVFIYCSIYPSEVADLMTYAQIVQGIAKSCGEDAAIAYDQKFRQIPVLWIKKTLSISGCYGVRIRVYIKTKETALSFKFTKTKVLFHLQQGVTPACLPLLRR